MLAEKGRPHCVVARMYRLDVSVEQIAKPIVIGFGFAVARGIAHAGILHDVGHAVRAE